MNFKIHTVSSCKLGTVRKAQNDPSQLGRLDTKIDKLLNKDFAKYRYTSSNEMCTITLDCFFAIN